jgi:transposase
MSVPDEGGLPRSVTGGVDWSKDTHAVCIVDHEGGVVERVAVAHSKAGIDRLVCVLVRYQVSGVGIERPDGPVVDAMLAAGLTVFVIPPSQIKSLRRRYGSAGHKDDRFDAYVLADTVRTDRLRLTPLTRDTQDTIVLRSMSRARKDLVRHRVAMTNQLRAHLDLVLPGVVGLFTDLDSPISRAFLAAFATQDAVDALTVDSLTQWLVGQKYHKTAPQVLLQRLHDAPRGPAGAAFVGVTHAYLAAISAIADQIKAIDTHLDEALTAHPDGKIFTSLPRAGTVRAARLLAEIGDARGRFPTPASLAGLAGVTPSTRQSGTLTIIAYRWAVDRQLRDAVCDFAADSRQSNPWAANLYHQARARGARHPHAVRILARAWLTVIWKLWTTHTPYDPNRHGALKRLLEQESTEGV